MKKPIFLMNSKKKTKIFSYKRIKILKTQKNQIKKMKKMMKLKLKIK